MLDVFMVLGQKFLENGTIINTVSGKAWSRTGFEKIAPVVKLQIIHSRIKLIRIIMFATYLVQSTYLKTF